MLSFAAWPSVCSLHHTGPPHGPALAKIVKSRINFAERSSASPSSTGQAAVALFRTARYSGRLGLATARTDEKKGRPKGMAAQGLAFQSAAAPPWKGRDRDCFLACGRIRRCDRHHHLSFSVAGGQMALILGLERAARPHHGHVALAAIS